MWKLVAVGYNWRPACLSRPTESSSISIARLLGRLFSFIKIRCVWIVFSHVSGRPSVLLRIRFCAVAYTTLVEKPRGSRHLEDLDTEKWLSNEGRRGLYFYTSGYWPRAGFCQCGNEPSCCAVSSWATVSFLRGTLLHRVSCVLYQGAWKKSGGSSSRPPLNK